MDMRKFNEGGRRFPDVLSVGAALIFLAIVIVIMVFLVEYGVS
jgi:hypothetical protein